jgi:4-amino-4-deoxy-L-arabinose transferase-like glycosyltransferase
MKKIDYIRNLPHLFLYLILTIYVSGNSFFWDTIQLTSSQAHWFYDNNFKYFFLPEHIDSGHPPIWGFYIAILWKIFGRNLEVSHFSVLPFLFGIIIQIHRLLKVFFDGKTSYVILLVLLADPTLLAQSILVSPDIALVFFFFLSFNSILKNNKTVLGISLVLLSLISMRGMMHVAILFIFHLFYIYLREKNIFIKTLSFVVLTYLPAGILAALWLYLHFLKTGWIGYHNNSPWMGSFELVDLKGFARNIFILGWRLIDFGRIWIWLLAIPVFFYSFKRNQINENSRILAVLFFITIFVLTPNMLLHTNLLGHRYLIIIYLSFALLVFYQLSLIAPLYIKRVSISMVILLLCGNFLVYPEGIAQGWDASLAHYPYYNLRREMIAFVEKEKIPFEKIGTAFPNNIDIKDIDLANTSLKFADRDLDKNEYIFYSNVFNDFTDKEICELKKWHIIKKLESLTVNLVLYKKPKE